MNKKQADKRIKELRKVVEYHAKKYYDEDKPEISDFEYDMMMLELRALESQFPELITETSLTQKVGGNVKEGYQKVDPITINVDNSEKEQITLKNYKINFTLFIIT